MPPEREEVIQNDFMGQDLCVNLCIIIYIYTHMHMVHVQTMCVNYIYIIYIYIYMIIYVHTYIHIYIYISIQFNVIQPSIPYTSLSASVSLFTESYMHMNTS